MIYIGFFILVLAVLLIASITDLKIREVPDWLSYSFLFTAVIANLILSVMSNDYWIILNSLAGVVFGFILGVIFFYTGQWGGGDSKIIMGLLALIGVNVTNVYNLIIGNTNIISYLLNAEWFLLIINFSLAGAIYGLVFSIILAIKKRKVYSKAIKKESKNKVFKLKRSIIFITTLCLIFLGFILSIAVSDVNLILSLGGLGLFIIIMFYIWAFANAIDKGCMHKKIKANKITIGDWVIKEVFIKRKVKNLLAEALHEYRIRTEKVISIHKFENKLALNYIKFTKGFFAKIFCTKTKLNDTTHLLRLLMKVSSKSKLIANAKKLKMSKKETANFLAFLEQESIYFDRFLVCSMQNTGLNELQVKLLQKLYSLKKVQSVIVKEGIPFIPAFLIGFIAYYAIGFWWVFLF